MSCLARSMFAAASVRGLLDARGLVFVLAVLVVACTRQRPSDGLGSPAASTGGAGSAALRSNADVVQGQALYTRYCELCHARDGSGYAADNAPSLVSATFLESATDEFLRDGIRFGRPGTAMAAYGRERGGPLDASQVQAIVRFLRAKGPAHKPLPALALKGDEARGAASFQKNCSTCHGVPPTRGTALSLHNPELLAAASPEFLRHAIVHGRPTTPMPPFEGKLPAAEIDDLVVWLKSFTPPPAPLPAVEPKVPENLPLVVNPKGSHPKFTLRDERFVAAADVAAALQAKQRIVIIDARAPSDWLQFHIPGSVPIPYYDTAALERIPNDGTWVVAYCACPHHASGEVVDALRRRKYPNTAVIDEGILVWRDRGYPLEGQSVPPEARPALKKR